ncbi:signal peptide containing protein [Theileria equi strain WA]|uniref:Signal peptide containing protein n=1 Tax=Theileria equi strain WA TaxID=1537102 RepID=L1LAW6_THEEQ|nr:signal peptide containing protein [Theileria equi strain WA]EKX72602.1 signal peptide containing protein [Theileria equi strain WA]|eukprot:XP_004832054.1 signal peptide containing protein [Theileria equi strain WA]
MRILAVLWTVCLLGLCHCKGSRVPGDRPFIEVLDDYTEDEIVNDHPTKETRKGGSNGKRQVWDMANGTVYEGGYNEASSENLRSSPQQPVESPRPTPDTASTPSKESSVTESAGKDGGVPSLESDPGTIDVNHPDSSLCDSFDYYYDDSLTRLIAPLSGKSIEKLKDDTKKIWSLGSGEILQHAKVYLNKDKKAEVMFVVVKNSSGITRTYYVKNDIGWVETLLPFPDRINEIKAKATNVTIDIGNEKDTEQCHLISTELLGLKVKMFIPGFGYHAKEVKDGDKSLWKAAENSGERCLSCDIYTKENNSPLLLITIKDKEFKSEYFEKGEGGWKSTTKEEFGKKKNAMQTA